MMSLQNGSLENIHVRISIYKNLNCIFPRSTIIKGLHAVSINKQSHSLLLS